MPAFDIRPWLVGVVSTLDTDLFDVQSADDRALLIRAQHPALAAAIDDDVDEVLQDGEPMSPGLHLTLHEIVLNQLVEDDPPAVRRTARRLERQGHDRHEIVHMIAGGVTTELWSALHDHAPADVDRYIAYLDGLPASWYDDRDASRDEDTFEVLGPPTGDGPAATLVAAMLADGVDLRDQAAVDAWVDDFNARPDAERAHLLPDPRDEIAPLPVALPDDATLASAALATPAMTQLARFVTWLDDGRALTQKGNLKLADGKHLVGLLGTDDHFDRSYGGRPYRTQSTTQLFGVDLVHRLAVAGGLARRERGSLRRARRGTWLVEAFAAADAGAPAGDVGTDGRIAAGAVSDADADQVLDSWRTVVFEMIGLGLVAGEREDRYGGRWWEGTLNDGVVDLLATMLLTGAPLSVDRLVEVALARLEEDYDLARMSEWGRAGLPDSIAWGFSELTDRLVWLGVVTRDDVRVEVDPLDRDRRLGGRIALTPLGSWFVRPVLVAQGFDVPVIGALADSEVEQLLDVVGDWPPDAFETEVAAWAAGRSTAADELAAAARRAMDPYRIGIVFEALGVVGDDAEAVVRELGDDARYRPFAVAWLQDRSLDPLRSRGHSDTALDVVESLAAVIVTSGPAAAADTAAADDRVDTQLVEQLWRVDDPWVLHVLEALGAAPDKRLAKAARRALFKHRNRN